MGKRNGRVKTIIAIVALGLTAITLAVSIVYGYATLGHEVADNTKMQPEVKQNTEHRIKFEEKVSNIERDVGLILTEVQK